MAGHTYMGMKYVIPAPMAMNFEGIHIESVIPMASGSDSPRFA
jgi:hypothetical protein